MVTRPEEQHIADQIVEHLSGDATAEVEVTAPDCRAGSP